jgi:hypothetical protein
MWKTWRLSGRAAPGEAGFPETSQGLGSSSRAINDLCREYCRDNMDKMRALIEGRAEIVTKGQ